MPSLNSSIAEFLNHIRTTGKAESTVDYYSTILSQFSDFCGEISIEDVKSIYLIKWGRTWHHYQSVQRFFRWAKDEAQIIGSNPMANVSKPPLGQRERTLTKFESMKMLRAARFDFRCFLLAMRESIARPQEIRSAKWEDVRSEISPKSQDELLKEGKCYFVLSEYKGKNRRRNVDGYRVIPISPRLGRLLARLKERRSGDSEYIFVNHEGRPWTKERLRSRMRRLRKKTGIKADKNGEQVVCYTFRHTSATHMASLGVRDKMLAEIMGHTTTKMTQRYLHYQPSHMMNALDEARRLEREAKRRGGKA